MEMRRKQTRRNRNDDEGDESDESKDLVDEEEKEEKLERAEEKEVVSSKRIHKFKNRNKHQKKSDRDKSTKISSGEDEVQQTLAEMTQ
jgi:hypothetical protein